VYAPSGHGANVPEDYIKRVVSLTGISRDKKLITREEIKKVGRAIIEHEEGKFWVTEKEFNDGYNAAANSSSFLAALKTGGAAVGLLLLAFFGFLFMSK
jgi:hypothetical protein